MPFKEALDPNGQLARGVSPRIETHHREQPPFPELSARDAQNRFPNTVYFADSSLYLARPEHPLALFLDDLQWLMRRRWNLMGDLLTQPDVKHLLLIGAYRDNEVGLAHPLMSKLGAMRRAGVDAAGDRPTPLLGRHPTTYCGFSHCEPDQNSRPRRIDT